MGFSVYRSKRRQTHDDSADWRAQLVARCGVRRVEDGGDVLFAEEVLQVCRELEREEVPPKIRLESARDVSLI